MGHFAFQGTQRPAPSAAFWSRALFQARPGETEAGVPAPGHPPRAARLPVAAPSRVPRAQRGRASRADRCARGAYPGDDRGVPGGGREQQEQQQQRGAARAPHGALGAGGGWGPLGARGRSAEKRAGVWREPRAVIKASPAVTHAGARPAARAGGTARAHAPRPTAPARPPRPPPSAPRRARAAARRPRLGRHAGSAPRGAPRSRPGSRRSPALPSARAWSALVA